MPPNCPSTAPPSAAKEEFRGRLHQSLARMLAKAPVGHWHHWAGHRSAAWQETPDGYKVYDPLDM